MCLHFHTAGQTIYHITFFKRLILLFIRNLIKPLQIFITKTPAVSIRISMFPQIRALITYLLINDFGHGIERCNQVKQLVDFVSISLLYILQEDVCLTVIAQLFLNATNLKCFVFVILTNILSETILFQISTYIPCLIHDCSYVLMYFQYVLPFVLLGEIS